MDILWAVLVCIVAILGLVGCFLPVLPGPPLNYIAFLLLQLRTDPPFTSKFMWSWLGVVVVVTVLEYIIPVYGAKRFGGSKYGVWGTGIGLVVGLFFGLVGIIVGPFVGALVGELIATQNSSLAMKAALGSFFGFLVGTLLKVIVSIVMCYYVVKAIIIV